MLDGDFLEEGDEEISKEHLKVLNCDFKNSFIRGWNRTHTIDLICHKIKNLFELDNFIYPEEILIVCRDEENENYFSERLSAILDDEEIFKQINFLRFTDFLNTYAPAVGEGKRSYKQVSLKRNSRVVFLLDPPEKYRRHKNFIILMSRLFPGGGAKLFFCEYENFIDPYIVLNGFPGAVIIKLGKETETPLRTLRPQVKPIEETPKPEPKLEIKEPEPKKKVGRFEAAINALRERQMEGESFYDFYMEVNPREKEMDIKEAFVEIFRNEFQIYLLWLEINRRNIGGERVTNDLFMDVNRLIHYNHSFQRKIEMGELKYTENLERMFIDLGVREELNKNHPGKWKVLREMVKDLRFPENHDDMMGIVNSRIRCFSEMVVHNLFVKNWRIVEPKLIHLAGYTPKDKRWRPFNSPEETNGKDKDDYKPNLPKASEDELFLEMVGKIKDSQSRGGSLSRHRILIGNEEKEEIIGKYFCQIFRNEFQIFMNLLKVMKHINNRASVPEGLMAEILKWPHYAKGSLERIIRKRIIYTGRIEEFFEDLGIGEHFRKWNPEIWAIFLKISEDLTFEKDRESLGDILNSRIENEAKLLKNEVFVRSERQAEPQFIFEGGIGGRLVYKNPKDQEKLLEIMNSWTPEEMEEKIELIETYEPKKYSTSKKAPVEKRESSRDERLEGIIEKLKEFQNTGWTLNYYQILVGPHEEEKMIRKYFSKIFHNEFEIFTSCIRIIKNNIQNIPIPERILERIGKWPNLNTEAYEKIVDERKVYTGGVEEVFVDLGIRDHFLKISPDIWAIFLKIISDLSFKGDLDNLISTINSRVFNESKLIKNELFERVEGKLIPEWIFVPKRRTISYISPEDQKFFSTLLESQFPTERKTISEPKTEGRIIMEKIKKCFFENWSLKDFLKAFSPHFGGPIAPLDPWKIEDYERIVSVLREKQNSGNYYEKFYVLVPPNEKPALLRTLHFRIFLNEFPFAIRLIRMAQIHSSGGNVPENLIAGLSSRSFWSKNNLKKIATPQFCNLNNINNVLGELEIKKPQIALLLKDIVSKFDPFDPLLIDHIYIKIFHSFREMDDGIFRVDEEIKQPEIIEKQTKVKFRGFLRRLWERLW